MLSVLTQFVLRLALGLVLALVGTPHALVDSGFFRVHLWVLLGLYTLASLSLWSGGSQDAGWPSQPALTLSIVAAALSYVSSIVWLYDRPTAGKGLLIVLVVVGLATAWTAMPAGVHQGAFMMLDVATGAAVLGFVFSAMLLGHWYLNTPTMHLDPLKRLMRLLFLAVALRSCVAATGLGFEIANVGWPDGLERLLLGLRWVAGLLGVGGTAWMAWQTLKIPNTQSATGILYVSLILAFLGELIAQMLSASTSYPL